MFPPPHNVMHESAHVVVARHLGLTVDWVYALPDGSGKVFVQERGHMPQDLYHRAVAIAAGPVVTTRMGENDEGCATDHKDIESLWWRYHHAAGVSMPNPYHAARAILREPAVARALDNLSRAMCLGSTYNAHEIERMMRGEELGVASRR